MVRLVHQGIRIQSRIDHYPVDQVVYHGCDAVDATKSVVERGLFRWLHANLLLSWNPDYKTKKPVSTRRKILTGRHHYYREVVARRTFGRLTGQSAYATLEKETR